MSLEFELEEIKLHNKEDDAWVIINGRVYDVTSFMDAHPGFIYIIIIKVVVFQFLKIILEKILQTKCKTQILMNIQVFHTIY
jgi:hypothetical protein